VRTSNQFFASVKKMSDQETNTDSKRSKREREEKEESQVQEEEGNYKILLI
jgi:hypothetical protein